MLRALVDNEGQVLQWPMWAADIREAFPEMSFPETDEELEESDLSHLGLINVPPTLRPEPSAEGFEVVLDTPVWIDGVLTRTYREVEIETPEE